MKKRLLAAMLAAAMLGLSLTGCYKTVNDDLTSSEDTADSSSSKIITVSDASSEDETQSDDETDIQSEENESVDEPQPGSQQDKSSTGGNSSQSNTSSKDNNDTDGDIYARFDKYYEYGARHIERAAKDFWRDGYMIEVLGKQDRTLWPYTIYVEAVGERVDADPKNAAVRAEYQKCLDTFEIYLQRGRRDGLMAYACGTTGTTGQWDRFYDDNAWVCLEFIHAYERGFGSGKHYLDKAIAVAEFCYSGWDTGNALGIPGGVFWVEGSKNEKNTCINAPLAYAYALLYEKTKNSTFLDRAKQIYDWTKKYMMNPPVEGQEDRDDYLYYDRVELKDGQINWDRTPRAYNVGNMIAAGAKLYKITGNKQYLTDAQLSAAASYNRFGKDITRNGVKRYAFSTPDDAMFTWFNSNLLKGYLELYKVDKTPTNRKYVESFRLCLAYACTISKDERGYVAHNWKAIKEDANPDMRGIGGTARVLFMLDKWVNGYYDK